MKLQIHTGETRINCQPVVTDSIYSPATFYLFQMNHSSHKYCVCCDSPHLLLNACNRFRHFSGGQTSSLRINDRPSVRVQHLPGHIICYCWGVSPAAYFLYPASLNINLLSHSQNQQINANRQHISNNISILWAELL